MLSLRACNAAGYLVLCSLDVQQPLLAELVELPRELCSLPWKETCASTRVDVQPSSQTLEALELAATYLSLEGRM